MMWLDGVASWPHDTFFFYVFFPLCATSTVSPKKIFQLILKTLHPTPPAPVTIITPVSKGRCRERSEMQRQAALLPMDGQRCETNPGQPRAQDEGGLQFCAHCTTLLPEKCWAHFVWTSLGESFVHDSGWYGHASLLKWTRLWTVSCWHPSHLPGSFLCATGWYECCHFQVFLVYTYPCSFIQVSDIVVIQLYINLKQVLFVHLTDLKTSKLC